MKTTAQQGNWVHPRRRMLIYEHLAEQLEIEIKEDREKEEAFQHRLIELDHSIKAKYSEGANEIHQCIAVRDCRVDEHGGLVESEHLADFTDAEDHEEATGKRITRLLRALKVHQGVTASNERIAKTTKLQAVQAKLELASHAAIHAQQNLVDCWNGLMDAILNLNQQHQDYETIFNTEFFPLWREVGARHSSFPGDDLNCCRAAVPVHAQQPFSPDALQDWAHRSGVYLKNPRARDAYTGAPAALDRSAFLSQTWKNFKSIEIESLLDGRSLDGKSNPQADEAVGFGQGEMKTADNEIGVNGEINTVNNNNSPAAINE